MEHNTYLLKALDAYPYAMEDVIESITYALSYEPNNPVALCLMGRIYFDVYQDYNQAIAYFESALAENVREISVYSHYTLALVDNEDFEKAEKFIDFALTVKGSDGAMLYARKASIYECQFKLNKAKKTLKEARKHTFNNSFMEFLDDFEKRLDRKLPEKTKANVKAKKK